MEDENKYNKLTEKQKRFIDYYIETGNATESAKKAGYSNKTAKNIGAENLTKLNFFIQKKLEEKENQRIASQDEVLQYLTSVLRGESESEIVVVEGTGDGCSQAKQVIKKPDEKEKLRAAELLGKRYGLYVEKKELAGGYTVELVDDVDD